MLGFVGTISVPLSLLCVSGVSLILLLFLMLRPLCISCFCLAFNHWVHQWYPDIFVSSHLMNLNAFETDQFPHSSRWFDSVCSFCISSHSSMKAPGFFSMAEMCAIEWTLWNFGKIAFLTWKTLCLQVLTTSVRKMDSGRCSPGCPS